MDQVRDMLKNPTMAGIVGFIIGLIIGWFAIGWGVWPITWTDAAPGDLRPDARVDYLRMAIDNYAASNDAATAQRRWVELGDAAVETLSAIEENPAPQSPANIVAYKAVVASGEETIPVTEEGGTNVFLVGGCIVTALLIGALLVMYLFRRSGTGEMTPAMQAMEAARDLERTDYVALGEEPPLTQFVTTFMLGDDLFDDSFSIDSPAGEFLGECGVGISDTIGVGDPKRVSAFEVWLFDKNDIQTVTKVVMSPHAYRDPAIRERLAAKGEPIVADYDIPAELETQTLRLTARIADMSTGGAPMPEGSFFQQLTLELAIWQK
jgi:hypothetical protein